MVTGPVTGVREGVGRPLGVGAPVGVGPPVGGVAPGVGVAPGGVVALGCELAVVEGVGTSACGVLGVSEQPANATSAITTTPASLT
ncbi:hypothetical protein GCM10009745_49110 [Kribbella yunnanensis]|uniref:Uncharacterized protein n=1 Tax=Kribbella yunnanensis TaxID=190194 RepID=A0ABP4U156_9ACTN